MAEIKGFPALRFTEKAGSIRELTCPPYDIISEEQRKAYLMQNSHNVIRLELPREGADPYEEAGKTLRSWMDEGLLATDSEDGIYIYEEEFTVKGQTYRLKGFICRVKLEPFSKGVVLPHEETLSKAKADRFNLMQATGCNFSQIYSLYMDEEAKTSSLLAKLSAGRPDVEFTDGEGIVQRLWIVTDPAALETLSRQFAERKLYIADGHHRYETALNYRNDRKEKGLPLGDSDSVMMMLVDMENDGLVVFPTHRIVRGLEGFSPEDVLEKCGDYFDIEKKTDPSCMEQELEALYHEGKKAFGFYFGEGWYLLTLKELSVMDRLLPDACAALRTLDVSVLHTLILERLMGIDKENMANQKNLTYTRDIPEALSAVDSGTADCSFILNPTRVSEIRDVAAAGGKMPQKSTYFYPKLITGLVMNKIL